MAPLDVRLYKIQNPPSLPLIPFPDAAESDLNRACTMIGWGKGKGAIVAESGWQWGDDTTKAKRWGTNITGVSTSTISYLTYSYNATYTLFDASKNQTAGGQTEAGAAMSDSGGGLFQQFTSGGPWKLSALMTLANYVSSTYPGGATLYNPNGSYASFAVRTKDFAASSATASGKPARALRSQHPQKMTPMPTGSVFWRNMHLGAILQLGRRMWHPRQGSKEPTPCSPTNSNAPARTLLWLFRNPRI